MQADTEHDYLINSVIVETISMVVSRPTKTTSFNQENNTNLKNFKKFKKVTVKNCTNFYEIGGNPWLINN